MAARRRLASSFPLVNDHPDVAGVLRDRELLAALGPLLAEPYRDKKISAVVAPEARGPILGALVAIELGAGLILARKDERNHPGADIHVKSEVSWTGTTTLFQARSFDLSVHDRVLLVDDWITTGSTLRALRNILTLIGSDYVGSSVLVNKASAETIEDLRVHTLVDCDDLLAGLEADY